MFNFFIFSKYYWCQLISIKVKFGMFVLHRSRVLNLRLMFFLLGSKIYVNCTCARNTIKELCLRLECKMVFRFVVMWKSESLILGVGGSYRHDQCSRLWMKDWSQYPIVWLECGIRKIHSMKGDNNDPSKKTWLDTH